MLAIDVAETSWEIQRYRIWRHKLVGTYRQHQKRAAAHQFDRDRA
ncbi:hypothetical protein [Bradyrhizobium sp. 139]|nr:hypothetical protein [Bradyrhizobium sp. 139]